MHYSKKFMISTGVGAILLIVGGIIFWAGADWPTTASTGPFPPVSVWDYFNEGFSIYSPFIAGGIALTGIAIHYVVYKYRIDIPGRRKDVDFKIDEFGEKIDKIFILEKEINEKITRLEETQNKILDQMADLRKGEELENPPI